MRSLSTASTFWNPWHRVRGCVRPQVPNPRRRILSSWATHFPRKRGSRGNARPQAPLSFVAEIIEEEFLPSKTFHSRQWHARQTTTTHARLLFHVAKKRPNFLVGGIAENFGQAYGLGVREEFIWRATNTIPLTGTKRRSFHYHPDDLIITSSSSITPIFTPISTRTSSHSAPRQPVPRRGRVIAWGGPEAGEALGTPPQRGGLSARSFATASIRTTTGCRQRPIRWRHHDFSSELQRRTLCGHPPRGDRAPHVLNSLAALIVAQGRGIRRESIQEALSTFRSVKRRMDVKGEVDGVLVVDDFAHHPTAVKATIEAARLRWPGKRLWAVLERVPIPCAAKFFRMRCRNHWRWAIKFCLQRPSRGTACRRPAPRSRIRRRRRPCARKDARVLPGADAIADLLAAEAKPGELAPYYVNGSFDGLCEKLLKRLAARNAASGANAR